MRNQMEGKGDDEMWRLLVKKMAFARFMSCLARRKRPEEVWRKAGKCRDSSCRPVNSSQRRK